MMCSCQENYSSKNSIIINDSKLTESNQELNSSEASIQTKGDLQTIKPKDFDISTETFNNTNESKQIKISINYPQITGFHDTVLQTNINELIKEAALDPYSDIANSNDGITNGTEWPVDYSIEYANNYVLSVKFEGYIYAQGSAHGTNWVYSVNINIPTGKKITIDGLFDKSFKDKLHQCFNGIDVDTTNSDETAINEIFGRFKNNFEMSDDNFYFTADKFIIILPIDDYYQFAASYEDLKSSMKENNSIWCYILDSNFQ